MKATNLFRRLPLLAALLTVGGLMATVSPASAATSASAATGLASQLARTRASATAPNSTGSPAEAPASRAPAGHSLPALHSLTAYDTAQRAAITAASARAARSHGDVVISALNTPTTQVAARPGGGLTLTDNTQPVRTEHDGAWVAVNTTLRKAPGGGYSPLATAYGSVTFSGGGTQPLVTTRSGPTTFSLSWPAPLPAPAVSGDTATYENVLPGVNLVLYANAAGGFSDVLVVTSAAAARDRGLASLSLPYRVTGGTLAATKADGFQVSGPSGGDLLESSSPLMWDSSTAVPASTRHRAQARAAQARAAQAQAALARAAASDPSGISQPGLAAHVAPLRLTAAPGRLTLVPDEALLRSRAAVFPAYLDPSAQWHPYTNSGPSFDEVKQGSPCNGASYYDNTGSAGDYGQLGVGVSWWGTCEGIMRAYYQWSLPSYLAGAQIQSASVAASEVYQANGNCSASRTVDLHWAGGINSGTDWNNQPGYLGGSADYTVATTFGGAYNPSYCTGNGAADGSFGMTGPIQDSASAGSTQITVALAEDGDESSGNDLDFARFADNPALQISYDQPPQTPSAANLTTVSGSDTLDCATSTPYPYMGETLASNTPVLDASVYDSTGDQLQAEFKYWLDGSSTSATATSANVASGTTASYSLPSGFTSSLTNGQTVDWQAEVTNGDTFNGGQVWSGWSPVCHFTAEPTGPNQPSIAANPTYPDTDEGGKTGASAGTTATFGITGNSSGAEATRFYYDLDQRPATSGTPAGEIARPLGTDSAGVANWWKLTDGSGTTAANAADSADTATLSGTGATWTSDSTRTQALALNGSSGSLALPDGIVDGATSLTVHMWFKTTSGGILFSTGNSAIGASNPSAGAMPVLYVGGNGKLYGQFWTGSVDPIVSPGTVNDGTWHEVDLAGAPGTETMYLDGTEVGAISGTMSNIDPMDFAGAGYVNTDGWAGLNAGSFSYFGGEISDIQTYTSALTASSVSAMYNTNNAAITLAPMSPGPHTLWVASVDAAGDVSGEASYTFSAAMNAPVTCTSLAACYDNASISPDGSPGEANADGEGDSMSATDLAGAGWASGGRVTIDGATMTLPAYGSGQADNVLAANQTIDYRYAASGTGISSLMFLASATDANGSQPASANLPTGDDTAPFVAAGDPVVGEDCFDATDPTAKCPASGYITYSNGGQEAYYLTVPDWITGPSASAAVVLPHENTTLGQLSVNQPKIYAFSVPLYPGQTVTSVTLPDLTGSVTDGGAGQSALHIYSLGTRDTTTGTAEANGTTAATPSGRTWTGAWASDTENIDNFIGSDFGDQTFRIAVKPSISGGALRVRLDNALGASPLDIGAATVAVDATSGGLPTSTPGGSFATLTFGGSDSTVIPEGGMVYSDPLTFGVTAGQWLIVSFELTNSIPDIPEHSWANTAYDYMSAVGSGNQTADTTFTSAYNGWFTTVLDGLDVQTAGIPTQVVLGDGLIDAWQPDTEPLGQSTAIRLSDDLADAEPSTPQPYGTIAAGIESNQISVDDPETYDGGSVGGPSALSRIDRDILDEPGIDNVVLFEGLEDVLTGSSPATLESGYGDLLNYLGPTGISTDAIGLTPCTGYTGDGDTGTGTNANDACTAAVDASRTTVNDWLAQGTSGDPSLYYIDPDPVIGVPNATDTDVPLNADAVIGTSNGSPADYANLTLAGYGALASAVLGPQDTWQLNDGTLDPTATTASDTADASSAYLQATDGSAGSSPLALQGGYSWANDSTRGDVLQLDGSSGYGSSGSSTAGGGPVVDTADSFSVSAWAKLSSLSNGYATVAAESGNENAGFYLQYNTSWGGWCLNFLTTDTANAGGANGVACTTTTPSVGTWYHLVGVYDAATQTSQLYIDGTLNATGTGLTPWAASGPLTIGEGQYDASNGNYFPGDISDVQLWNYALTAPQVTALYDQIS